MDHLAIMRKSWNLTHKILTGEKKIESRWYMNKYQPWGKIKNGDVVYFKDSGSLVKVKAEVSKVIQYENLTPSKVKEIFQEYGSKDGIAVSSIPKFVEMFKDKKYCILIFLKNPEEIKPFDIDKKGYGNMAAWISVDDINQIKK
ncbi:hypothetical protein KY334_01075 [Candidatus Woesearchaeota archaeon]|nr:hypothetical protein [Candidatus Woesearchaeota archaeon]